MKAKRTQITKACILCAVLAQASSSISYGNLRLVFDTDASGFPTSSTAAWGSVTGSFSGVGTPDSNIATGGNNHFITGVGSGDMLGVHLFDSANAQNFSPDVIGMDTTFNFGGGTADVELATGGGAFKGWNIDNLQGASKIGITSVFADPFHGRSNSSLLAGLPWGFSNAVLNPGTGFGATDFDVMYTIGGLQYYPSPATAASTPSPIPAYTPFASTQWDNSATPNTLTFHSSNGYSGTVPNNGPYNEVLVVRGFDDENTSFDSVDAREFYADTFSLMITPLDALGNPTTFASDASFVFSYDGDRLIDFEPEVIPEPSRALLMAVGLGLMTLRRRR